MCTGVTAEARVQDKTRDGEEDTGCTNLYCMCMCDQVVA